MAQKKVCMIFLRHAALDCRIYYKEARTLRDAGYDVHLLGRLKDGAFTDMGGNPVAYPDSNGEWKYDGMTFHGIPKRAGLIGKYLEYRDLVKVGLSIKASMYHCHESDIAMAAAITIKKKLNQESRLIFDLHEFWPVSWKEMVRTDVRSLAFQIFTPGWKKSINASDFIITANTIVRGHLLVANRFKNVVVLENAPVLSIFKEPEGTRSKSNSVVLCHEGALDFNRGFREMVLLVEKNLPRVRLKIIGSVFGEEKKWLDALYKEKPYLSRSIEITGWLPYEDVGTAISSCDVGLIMFYPTINNMLAGPPNKLYNYMRYGLPIVSMNLPETQALISKYRCGIVVNDWSMTSFINSIQYLIDHPNEAEAMGRRGKDAILNELSWEQQGEKLLKIYDQLLNPKPFILP